MIVSFARVRKAWRWTYEYSSMSTGVLSNAASRPVSTSMGTARSRTVFVLESRVNEETEVRGPLRTASQHMLRDPARRSYCLVLLLLEE